MVRDVHAVLESGLQVVCVDDSVLWFNRALVSQAEAAGITVVGVRSTGDPGSDDRLAALGVAYRVSDSVAPGLLLDQLTRLRPRDTFDEIVSHLELADGGASGGLLVVGGPPGAGSREVAIGVVAELAAAGSAVLVDCNESSPGVARRLGLQLQPHVLDAVEVATAGGDLRSVLAVPAETVAAPGLPFDVIVGLPAASEWRRWSPASADVVVAACRGAWDHTVVTTSPIVEDLRRWVDRYGVSRHLLTSSAAVLGVCEATPRGVSAVRGLVGRGAADVDGADRGEQGAGFSVLVGRGGRAAAVVVRVADRRGGVGPLRPSRGRRRVGRGAVRPRLVHQVDPLAHRRGVGDVVSLGCGGRS